MDHLSNALTILYYIVYPIVFILTLLLYILGIITAPLLHLGHYFLHALWYPVHILGKFETLYIFFGVAVLVGIITGTCIHYAYSFISSLLDLMGQPEEQRGRTLASYRRQRQQKAEDPLVKVEARGGGLPTGDVTPKEEYRDWEWSKQSRGKKRDGLINTILEEDSTDDY